MKIDDEEILAFTLAGSVDWDSTAEAPRWNWKPAVPTGFVVYLMVVGRDVRKGGKAEDTRSSTFKRRVEDEFRAVGQVIRGPVPGRPIARWRTKKLDPFKQHAP